MTVNRKLVAALKHHLMPIVCIGEHEEQREDGKTEEVLCRQISRAIRQIDPVKLRPMVMAYEPIWAIGREKRRPRRWPPKLISSSAAR